MKAKLKKIFQALLVFERDLTRAYVLALSSVALLILVFHSVKYVGQNKQLELVNTLRLVDKQIYRTERIATLLLEAQLSLETNAFNKKMRSLQNRISIVKKYNGIIIDDLTDFDCQSKKCRSFLETNSLGQNLDSLTRPADLAENSLAEASKEIEIYQNFLIKADSHLDSQINTSANNLISLDILFDVLLIFVLLVQALWVFRPAVRRMNEALDARSDFISRISHEIRNPMNSIMGMAEILKSSDLKSDQRQNVDNLLRSSRVLLEMLNSLVDFSSSRNKKITLNPQKTNIYKVIDKVIDVISVPAHDKGVEVFVDVSQNISKSLIFDDVRLEQILLNLLNNALKFTEKGHIILKIKEKDSNSRHSQLEFSVEDSGIGISSEKLGVIFDSFVQEDSSVKRRFGGSGLGLSICREISTLMGTQIHVESEKGVGSKFFFSLKIEKDEVIAPYLLQNKKNYLVYFCDHKSEHAVKKYLESLNADYKILKHSDDVSNLTQHDFANAEFIVDDSIGAVEMAKVQCELLKFNTTSSYALMRSNFSRENMELLRKSKYNQFLIKPFREWHLHAEENDFISWIEDKNRDHDIATANQSNNHKGLSVLAVDDSKDNLYLLEALIKPHIEEIDLAENGLVAVEKMKEKNFDLVFMDIQMPVMDGYTAIKKIRSLDKNTPVYAVTAHASLVEEKKCIEAGFNGRITKPINKKTILSKIQNVSKNKIKTSIQQDDFESRMIKKLLPTYFEERLKDISKLESAMQEKNFESFKRAGHKIKGSAKSYGFKEIGDFGHALEKAAEEQNFDQCCVYAHRIVKALHQEKQIFESNV